RLIERLQRLPDVAAVGTMNVLPLATTAFTWRFHIEKRPEPEETPPARADYRVVTPGIFAAMQMPLTRGRLISDRDTRDSTPVATASHWLPPVSSSVWLWLCVMPATAALLFEVRPTDTVAYVGAALVLATLSLLATYLPARSVSRL